MKAAVALIGLAGCVQSHSKYFAQSVGPDTTVAHVSVSGFYGTDGEVDEDGVRTEKGSGLATANLGADYGLAPHVDAGGDLGTSGLELRAKFSGGRPDGIAFAIVPAFRADLADVSADLSAVVSFGPVSAVGFYGGRGQLPFSDPYPVFGGALGYRAAQFRVGLEVQRWDDPEDFTFAMIDVGYVLAPR